MNDAGNNALTEAPCAIFSFTDDGIITSANGYCHKLLEFEPGELEGTTISALLTLAGRIFYQTHFYPLVKLHNSAEEIFLQFLAKSKKEVPVVLNAKVTSFNNQPHIVCSFIPVPNRGKYEAEILLAKKKAEDALRQNEQLEIVKRELEKQQKETDRQIKLLAFQNNELLQLGNVITHDLQEPVRKLILFSTELLAGNLSAHKKERALHVIKRSTEKVKSLLLSLQEYFSLTTKVEEKKQVDLNQIVSDELLRLQTKFPKVELEPSVAPLPVIAGSERQLRMLFHQLIRNCFEHGSLKNRLNITIDAVIVKENLFNFLQEKYTYMDVVIITISDKGAGFDNKYKDYVFEFLKKLSVNEQSTGLGLSFCRKIVENHFGSIEAVGVPDGGATFKITLPVNCGT